MRRNATLTLGRGASADDLAPHSFLFRVFDCQRPLGPFHRHLLGDVDEIVFARGEGAPLRDGRKLRIPIADPYVSTIHATATLGARGWRLVDRSKNGTFVNGMRCEQVALADGDTIEVAGRFFIFRDDLPAPVDTRPDVTSDEIRPAAAGLATLIPALSQRFEQIERVARSPLAILLRGETGTGKEVLARAIHELSGRPGPFVGINCGALPDTLVESELFGARKGAYSGAVEDRPGLVRSADGGTLLLDEVGDLPLSSQAALLRVLQEREVMPVGGTKPVPVDLRVVSASHHELRALVAEGRFRADLEARLHGIEVAVPPLRDRREDVGLLSAAILLRVFPDIAPEVVFDVAAARALLGHEWPKNIRELEQVLTAAVVLAGRLPVGLQHLPASFRAERDTEQLDADPELRKLLAAKLEEHAGNVSAVARAMGKQRKQVQRWMKRLHLDPLSFRGSRRGR